MRVPAQARGSRVAAPAAASNKRAKAKRGASSEGLAPAKTKKRKLDAPLDVAVIALDGGVATIKRKPSKKTPVKKEDKAPKKPRAKKPAESKPRTKAPKKPPAERKMSVAKPKKVQVRKLSGAELSGVIDPSIGAVNVLIPGKPFENQNIIGKKAPKKALPKVLVNKVKAPRTPKSADDAGKKKSAARKPSVKRVPSSAAANKKIRRKAGDTGPMMLDAPSNVTLSNQLEVIDGVARNLTKPQKKAKENEEASAIKSKLVTKVKKVTKKTPKIDEELKNVDGIEREVFYGLPMQTTILPSLDYISGHDYIELDTKVKLVPKKALKEKKSDGTIKKKVVFQKTEPKVGVKTTKVTFKVKKTSGQPKMKRMTKKEKEAARLESLSFQDDYNSSTSDDCTLDLLLRRQKQLKQEDLKSENVDIKPTLPIRMEASDTMVKKNFKVKLETKNGELIKPLKKKLVKKIKVKDVRALIKKQSPALKKLKLATGRKIPAKAKRMRPNEVSRLGSGSDSEQRARRIKLFGFWSGPKRHRVASLNALAKVHCLYENESRGALLSVCARPEDTEAVEEVKTESTRTLRSGPGRRGIGQHWDQHTSSSSSSEDNGNSDSSSSPKQKLMTKTKPPKKVPKPRRGEVIMDLKDMVVRKRMASLNASAILSASYSPMEKLQKKPRIESPPVIEDDLSNRKKKSKKKIYLSKKLVEGDDDSDEEANIIELATANNKKVATVIVNQDTDVTITGVYVNSTTHRSSTTHEGYCSIAGMQYRISSTSHTQTEATAVATETLLHAAPDLVPAAPPLHPVDAAPPLQQPIKSYTPLGALSNMQPPGGPLSPLGRRHGCASAFSAPPQGQPQMPPQAHHHHHHQPPTVPGPPPEPQPPYIHGYYQPAGPLISAHHHHKPSTLPPLEASPTLTPPVQGTAPPPPASASTSRGGDESSDNDVVITATSCNTPGFAPGHVPQASGNAPPVYRYPSGYALPPSAPPHVHHQYPYVQYAPQQYYAAPVQSVAPPAHHYHAQELCYPPYYHPKTYAQPPVTYTRRYAPHPSQYYPQEQLYAAPTEPPASRQVVPTASTSGYQTPSADGYPPTAPMVDPYPPPPAPPYYPGYPPPAPPCYSHSPPTRSLQYIDTAYQGCPCPMQSCPKNVHTGPLTGEGKRPDPSAAMYLPPVALALPSEPPHALGPPSPARGSAGMHPTPSPHEVASSESRVVNVGLLTIHQQPSAKLEPTLNGTVNVGNKEQALTCDSVFTPVETKVAVVVENQVEAKVRKRKAKTEDAAAQKPKRRNVAAPKKMSTKSNQSGDVGSVENVELPSLKVKCKNQPLSTANSCSLHISKQNAKKRKSSSAEDLTENLEPVPLPAKGKPAKARAKEPKARPKLCPVKKETKAKNVKAVRKSIEIMQLQRSIQNIQTISVPPIKCTDENVITQTTVKTVQKTSLKSVPKTVVKSGPKLKPTLKTIMNTPAVVKPRKPSKSRVSLPEPAKKSPSVKVNCRRNSASHMLRSHGLQADLPMDTEAPLQKCKVSPTTKKNGKNGITLGLELALCQSPVLKRANVLRPKWSNGWCWDGEPFQAKVHLNSEESLVERLCYPGMRHTEGDIIRPRDCVLLKSGTRKADLPFVAKVAQLWENPDDGEMMVSLLWYYRPEHTDQGRRDEDMRDEIFASKHKDINSVACIEDKCYVLTFNEYCRYRALCRRLQDGLREKNPVVPDAGDYPYQSRQPGDCVSPDMVFFCRHVYDFRQKRILKNPV